MIVVGAALIKSLAYFSYGRLLLPRGRFFLISQKRRLETDGVRRFPLGAPPQRQFRQYHQPVMQPFESLTLGSIVSNVEFRLRSGMGATLAHTTTKPEFSIRLL